MRGEIKDGGVMVPLSAFILVVVFRSVFSVVGLSSFQDLKRFS